MECMCEFLDVGQEVKFLKRAKVKARKEHNCTACSIKIKKGEQYFNQSAVCDGELIVDKLCNDCQSVCDYFFCGSKFSGVWDELREYMIDNDGQFETEGVEFLTPKAREKFFYMVDDVYSSLDKHDEMLENEIR
jgi:hypothetical protein